MKKFTLLLTVLLVQLYSYAQDSFNQKFLEANTLMEESMFNIALPIWLDLSTQQPDNHNVNYKIGVCYLNSGNEKKKALDYLKKAAENTTANYDPFSSSEKKAPNETQFFLARAYHINYNLDLAAENYTKFKEKISKKHYLFNEVDHYIKQCENAKLAIAKPVNIDVINLGKSINTEFADYSPVMSLDESTIYFTSRRLRKDSSNYFIKDVNDGMHYEDIYVSHNYDGAWSEPELLSINTEGHEATINVSVDGQTLFIYKDDNGNGNLYYSSINNEEWTTPTLLGSDINSDAHESHVSISPDENILYFVSDRKGGLGGQDIYFCNKLPNGEWAKAQNIGSVINTPYDEDGVFIHPDGKTIYFSSHGHSSIGGYDIFYSIKNEEDGTWSTPINLGYPVNSTDDDVFFVTSADGKRGYYSSIQEKGFGEKDIYQISMTDAAEKPLTLLTGHLKVIGETETPADAQIVITNNLDGSLIGIFKPRKKDGKFSIILEPNIDYHIEYLAMGFKKTEDLFVPPVSAFTEINRGIELQDVIFGDDKNALTYLKGMVEYKKLLASGTKISLLDENDKVIESTKTDEKGQFTFKNLKPEEYYLVRLDEVNNDFADNAKVYVLNDKGEKVMLAVKKSKNRRLFKAMPNSEINKLPLIEEKDTETITKTDEKEPKEPKETKEVKDKGTSSNTTLIASYQEFFNYNIKEINTSDAKLIELVEKAKIQFNDSKKIVIEIEASASKVPTKTFGSNEELAKYRGEEAKKLLLKLFTDKGITSESVTFKKIKSLVQGPKYKGDPENKETYEKYQYVKINLK
ncbi:MAG: PD40 domain-containing protein [Flavobacteriales bacterium]|nr:PD40 domain-containing protein [Flavobacteriales bacterium]